MSRLFLSLLAILLLIEEWLWDVLSVLGDHLARLLLLARFEQWLSESSRATALIAFTIPILIVTPINLAALFLLAHGLLLQAVFLEIVAKLLGTLLIARVFALTKPQLLTFAAIAWLYRTITGWLHWAHERIRNTFVYRQAHRIKGIVAHNLANWIAHRPE